MLDGVGLTVPAGQTLALVGVSGAGKSTCAHLLARFWDPSEGAIHLVPGDGHPVDLRDLADADLRRAVAVVGQDAPLFVLGEATTHLDNAGDAQPATALAQGNRTTLVIAHRPATIRRADRVAVLESGRIAEEGTWDDLTARPDGALNRVLAVTPSCSDL